MTVAQLLYTTKNRWDCNNIACNNIVFLNEYDQSFNIHGQFDHQFHIRMVAYRSFTLVATAAIMNLWLNLYLLIIVYNFAQYRFLPKVYSKRVISSPFLKLEEYFSSTIFRIQSWYYRMYQRSTFGNFCILVCYFGVLNF